MPAPGDQHQPVVNPFKEPRAQGGANAGAGAYTTSEAASLQQRLERKLGPEYLSSRPGPSGKAVHYLAAEKCIALANEVFGFNGWSSSIQNIQVDYVDEHPQTLRVCLGISVVVRVTLRDGTFHEDIGYGKMDNCKGKAIAFEKAKKEATTDALKRALRHFGNVMGNCIYDADYVKKVTKVKVSPARFSIDDLHRHHDFVQRTAPPTTVLHLAPQLVVEQPVQTAYDPTLKPEPSDSFDEFMGDFDEVDFCVSDEGHPDEVVVSTSELSDLSAQTVPPISRPSFAPAPPQPLNDGNGLPIGGLDQRPQTPQAAQLKPPDVSRPTTAPPITPDGASKAFLSARAVSQLPDNGLPSAAARGPMAFNPQADSPSIRKTPGIDHSTSKPVNRHGQHVVPNQPPPPTRGPGNVVNPQLDQVRRLGAPLGHGNSPLANRGQYRRPTMKRPSPAADGDTRAALVEVSANVGSGALGNGAGTEAAKRQKTDL